MGLRDWEGEPSAQGYLFLNKKSHFKFPLPVARRELYTVQPINLFSAESRHSDLNQNYLMWETVLGKFCFKFQNTTHLFSIVYASLRGLVISLSHSFMHFTHVDQLALIPTVELVTNCLHGLSSGRCHYFFYTFQAMSYGAWIGSIGKSLPALFS